MSEEQQQETKTENENELTNEYKTSENAKKGVADILAADSEDESLRKYKESLLGAAAAGNNNNTTLLSLFLSLFLVISHFFFSFSHYFSLF